MLVLLALYWYGLRVWYQMDDFAWLNLHTRIHDLPSLLSALFQPLAQGTVRPLSERLYFLLGWAAGGMEAPWVLRGIAFLTQTANVLLLVALTRRLTGGSLLAGSAAAILWICNANLYVPMGWSAAFNQILCAFFLLAALTLWIRYTDTGESRWYWAQFGVFVLGFGALEINVVYPVLAALFALCFDRRGFVLKTAPMFVVSVMFAIVHRLSSPPAKSDVYRLYFDFDVFATIGSYLRLAFGAERYARFRQWPVPPFQAAEVVAGVALLALVIWALWRRQWLAAFGVGWFFAVLGPVIPLKNHVTDYYLFIPMIGLAMVGGWGLSVALSRGRAFRAAALLLAAVYAVPSALMARGMTVQYFIDSRRTRTFVRSVAHAHRLHPDKTIVVRHLDDRMFWTGWWDNPFQIFGRNRIFIAGEDEEQVSTLRDQGSLSRFFLSEREQLAGLEAGTLVVYEMLPDARLRNVTELRREVLARESRLGAPRFLNFGMEEAAAFLKDGWWQPEGHFRWSAGRAEFVIHGPSTDRGELVITGLCPQEHLAKGPVHVTVIVDGQRFPASTIGPENPRFELRHTLPAAFAARPSMNVAIEVDRVFQAPGDRRSLGLAVGTAEVTN